MDKSVDYGNTRALGRSVYCQVFETEDPSQSNICYVVRRRGREAGCAAELGSAAGVRLAWMERSHVVLLGHL